MVMGSGRTHIQGLLAGAMLMFMVFSGPLQAQHGHPLVGTWSGYLTRDTGQQMRALFLFEFSVDQVISGSVIINGRRFPFSSAELDHENDWTVTIQAEGESRAGERLVYRFIGNIENLSSETERMMIGTWEANGDGGEFQLTLN